MSTEINENFDWKDIPKEYLYITIDALDTVMYAHTNPPRHSIEQQSYINTHRCKVIGKCEPHSEARLYKRPKS